MRFEVVEGDGWGFEGDESVGGVLYGGMRVAELR